MHERWVKEYAVEVPLKGFVHPSPMGMFGMDVRREPNIIANSDDALKMLKQAKSHYERLGCPEVAKTLRVITRTRTTVVTHSIWEPLVKNEVDHA